MNTTAIATKETEVNCQNVTISEYQVTLYPEQEGVRQMHMKSISRIGTKHLQNINLRTRNRNVKTVKRRYTVGTTRRPVTEH